MNPLSLAPSQLDELISKLTPRQMQVLELLAMGNSVVEASAILSIKFDTARKHIYHACYKLDLENRIQLIVIFAMWKASNDKE